MPEQRFSEAHLRELRVMEQIERNPRVSQRELAGELGMALGVANACISTLVRKGLVKIRGESNRSLTYHLTRQGVLHKAALALEWTNNTIGDYVVARQRIRHQLDALRLAGVRRAVILGADEVAELIALIAPQAGIAVVGAVPLDNHRIADSLAGVPVIDVGDIDALAVDAAILAVTGGGQATDLRIGGLPIFTLDGQRLERSVS